MTQIDTAQSLDNLKLERDAIVLYDALAEIEKDPRRAAAFRTIAGNERRHAEVWATKLRELGADVPPRGPAADARPGDHPGSPGCSGPGPSADLVKALEGDEEGPTRARPRPRCSRSPPTSASTPRSGSACSGGAAVRRRSAPGTVRDGVAMRARATERRRIATSAGTGRASRGRCGR